MNLPEDLMNEILYFVPMKSLFRFKCVCRSWNSMIKEQCGSSLLIRNRNNCVREKLVTSLFRYDHNNNLKSHSNLQLELPPFCAHSLEQYSDADVRVVGPCNGLVCISILRRSDMEFVLWRNPSMTESSRIVPPFFSDCRWFDPAFGFGFDANANDYKIVKFRQCMSRKNNFHVEIYSTAKNSWRTFESFNYLGMLPVYGDRRTIIQRRTIDISSWVAVVFSKYCCWLTKGLEGGEIILSFDMSREVFLKTLLPSDALQPAEQTSQILALRDLLALIVGSDISEGSTFQIWTMKELNTGESWTKMATIGPISGRYRSLAFWRNYDSLILEDRNCNGLMSYDLRLHKTKQMGIDVAGLSFDMAFDYTQTSVSSVAIPSIYRSVKLCQRTPCDGRLLDYQGYRI